MICSVKTLGISGIQGSLVTAECYITNGLPGFDIVCRGQRGKRTGSGCRKEQRPGLPSKPDYRKFGACQSEKVGYPLRPADFVGYPGGVGKRPPSPLRQRFSGRSQPGWCHTRRIRRTSHGSCCQAGRYSDLVRSGRECSGGNTGTRTRSDSS